MEEKIDRRAEVNRALAGLKKTRSDDPKVIEMDAHVLRSLPVAPESGISPKKIDSFTGRKYSRGQINSSLRRLIIRRLVEAERVREPGKRPVVRFRRIENSTKS